MKLPTFDQASDIHKKYAPNVAAFETIWGHSQIVKDVALQVADTYRTANRDLISIGALLHDVGCYGLYEYGKTDGSKEPITHGLLGYEILRAEGIDETICRFALHHTGVGISKQDVENYNLLLPPRDYKAETDEEQIVMYADKFHSKTTPPVFNSVKYYRNYLLSHFGVDKAEIFDKLVQKFGEPDLKPLVSKYGFSIR